MIAYVEADEGLRRLVAFSLNVTGFQTAGYESVADFRASLDAQTPELILLDAELPGAFELLASLRARPETRRVPAIMTVGRSWEDRVVRALSAGADDCVAKPIHVVELVARMKALARRYNAGSDSGALRLGRVALDAARHTVRACDEDVRLTKKEFALLRYLMENAGQAIGRETLLQKVWGEGNALDTRTVDVHIQTLRKKLGKAGGQIRTLYALGYRFVETNDGI